MKECKYCKHFDFRVGMDGELISSCKIHSYMTESYLNDPRTAYNCIDYKSVRRYKRGKGWREERYGEYLDIIQETVESLPKSSEKCQIFCKPIGTLCKLFCQKINLPEEHFKELFECCKEIISDMMNDGWFMELLGNNRIVVASSIVYISSQLIIGENFLTHTWISQISHASGSAISRCSNKIKKLWEHFEDLFQDTQWRRSNI